MHFSFSFRFRFERKKGKNGNLSIALVVEDPLRGRSPIIIILDRARQLLLWFISLLSVLFFGVETEYCIRCGDRKTDFLPLSHCTNRYLVLFRRASNAANNSA